MSKLGETWDLVFDIYENDEKLSDWLFPIDYPLWKNVLMWFILLTTDVLLFPVSVVINILFQSISGVCIAEKGKKLGALWFTLKRAIPDAAVMRLFIALDALTFGNVKFINKKSRELVRDVTNNISYATENW